jgi:hypothetical protein
MWRTVSEIGLELNTALIGSEIYDKGLLSWQKCLPVPLPIICIKLYASPFV